jgi:hypothetical protein
MGVQRLRGILKGTGKAKNLWSWGGKVNELEYTHEIVFT